MARCACGLENLGQGDIRINLKTFDFFIFSFTFWPFSMIFFQSGSYKMCCWKKRKIKETFFQLFSINSLECRKSVHNVLAFKFFFAWCKKNQSNHKIYAHKRRHFIRTFSAWKGHEKWFQIINFLNIISVNKIVISIYETFQQWLTKTQA